MNNTHRRLSQLIHPMLLASAASLALLGTVLAAPATAARPNIVFVLFDDAGFSDFGAYGGEIATPNIDQIARQGVRFTNFHTASTCEATRIMLHSGVDNHRAGAGTLQVAIADNQKGQPGYEGHLRDDAHSLGQLMRDGGYATYFAGKWNIGDGLERSPGARGWDRYIALEQTGADNFEAKVYAPFNMEAVWWEDGQRARLPDDFYSNKHYADKLIGYVDQGSASGKPFFAMLSFQAVHSPLQAPEADIEKYLARYKAGWSHIRGERYKRQVQQGLVPSGLDLASNPPVKTWDQLSPDERREQARKMAVFAGMLDNADHHLGRLREHLRQTGQLDNTVFIVMSDNGADPVDLSQLNLPFKLWYQAHFALNSDRAGSKGSYTHYGTEWARVSNTPFSLFKGSAGEGGMRVPLVIEYPGRLKPGGVAPAFAYVTDFLPTVLDIAGIPLPGEQYQGRPMLRPSGVSLLPYLEGRAPRVHPPEAITGFEATGGQALFQGEYKLTRSGPPFGDGRWRLHNIEQDPTERQDLAQTMPAVYRSLTAQVGQYNQAVGVVLPEAGYDPTRQVLKNNWPVLLRQLGGLLGGALAAALVLLFLLWRGLRRWRERADGAAPT